MEDEPSCSTNIYKPQVDEGLPVWTRNLKFLATFRYDKLQKYLGLAEKPSTTKRDAKLGYGYLKKAT